MRDMMSTADNPRNGPIISFLPFLKVIWKHGLQAQMSIVHTLPKMDPSDIEYRSFLLATKMSLPAQALCNEDIHVARLHRTLGYIAIRDDGSGDLVHWTTSTHENWSDYKENENLSKVDLKVVKYKDLYVDPSEPRHVCIYSQMPFSLDDHGQLCLRPREDHTEFSMLPIYLRCKI
jgi:hypothetical protein